MENQAFLTEKQLAAKLQCSVPAIRVWRKKGLPALRFERLVRYKLEDVLDWFSKRAARG